MRAHTAEILGAVSLLAWLWLLLMHGRFWRSGQSLTAASASGAAWPAVDVVVPARDEAAVVVRSVGSLLAQEYAGRLRVFLVDDASTDGTGDIARGLQGAHELAVVSGTARPRGWAGKLWAMHQGVSRTDAPLILLTDADIVHDPGHVRALVAHAERGGADLVSEMVALNCESAAERALIPAFVYLFAMLYPFAWVNDGLRRTAAAAGGTVLVRAAALARIGGVAAIRGALIDDVALASAVKRGGRIWLGHSALARSIRPYPELTDIWRMVARSAYVQLRYSPSLLAATVLGLAVVFLAPPLMTLAGPGWIGHVMGVAAWAAMGLTFVPTLRRFGLTVLWAPALPLIACFYIAATLAAAVDHHRGRGVVWKHRAYTERQA